MAVLKAIQRGEAILSGTSLDVTLPSAIDKTKSFLKFTWKGTTTEWGNFCGRLSIDGYIVDSTTLNFARAEDDSNNDITIRWEVVEFSSGVTVQHGEETGVGESGSTISIDPIDPSKSFALVNLRGWENYDFGASNNATIRIIDSTTIELTTETDNPWSVTTHWQVIEYDNCSVQQITETLSGTSQDITIPTEIDTTKTAVFLSYRATGNRTPQNVWRAKLIDGNTVRFIRSTDPAQTETVVLHIVEFTDANVSHIEQTLASSETSNIIEHGHPDDEKIVLVNSSTMFQATLSTSGSTVNDWASAFIASWVSGSEVLSSSRQEDGYVGIANLQAISFEGSMSGLSISPSSIVGAEEFGAPEVGMSIAHSGIASEEVFGSVSLVIGEVFVSPDSIASEETFGETVINPGDVSVGPLSIESEETFGFVNLGLVIFANEAILSQEAFGDVSICMIVQPLAIESEESFGSCSFSEVIQPIGIESQETFGALKCSIDIQASSIQPVEAFGSPVISAGTITIQASSIQPVEAFGSPVISAGVTLSVEGIGSQETFGDCVFSFGEVSIVAFGLQSGEAFGTPKFLAGSYGLLPSGIASGENFGFVKIELSLKPNSILGEESWGNIELSPGKVNIGPTPITSQEVFGASTVRNIWVLFPNGIPSKENIGLPIFQVVRLNSFHKMMETDLDEVFFNEEEFAVSAIYEHRSGETYPLTIIFDEEYLAVDPDTGVQFISTNPRAACQTSKFRRKIAKGDKLILNGIRYEVISDEPDGVGVTIISLHKEKTI